MEKPKFLGSKYIPKYAENYINLPWYERDLMQYFDYLDYKDMSDNPDYYFKHKKMINFDIINNQCRGNLLQKTEKEHKTISNDDFKNYPE